MLEEFLSFKGEEMPPMDENPPKYIWNMKIERPLKSSAYSKYSELNLESLNKLEEEKMTLAEKVMKRQMEEKAKLEEKKQKILKELNKKKRINITKFLTREAGYEQKKMYNLEQKRFKELEQENKNFKEKPNISMKTIEICNNSKKKKKPIYLRTKEILEKKKKNIENLNIKIKKENKLNKSMDEINNNNKEYIVNNEIKNKKMTKKQMNEYYNNQKDWKNKINENRNEEYILKTEQESNKNKPTFHPKISRGTKEIILAMNEAKENYLYPTIETNNNNYYFLTDITPNQKYINYDNDVFKRLYENKKLEKGNKYILTFQPITNKNKYKKVLPKYKDILNKKKGNKKIKNKKSPQKKNINIEKNIKNKNKNKSEEKIVKEEKNINEPWTNCLFKLKKNKSLDKTYRLNIRQASAWNENDVNLIPLKGGSKEIVKYFL